MIDREWSRVEVGQLRQVNQGITLQLWLPPGTTRYTLGDHYTVYGGYKLIVRDTGSSTGWAEVMDQRAHVYKISDYALLTYTTPI